jgi:hypothetical protein
MSLSKAPVLAVDPDHVFVNCPFCDKVHVHHSNGDINKSNYGTRLSHCEDMELHGEYELVCDELTLRKPTEYERKWIEKTFGSIVP